MHFYGICCIHIWKRYLSTRYNFVTDASEVLLLKKLTSVLRTTSRLEAVYLATGSFEQGWKAACKRADVELDMFSDGAILTKFIPMVVCDDAESIFDTLPLRAVDTTTCISIICLSTT